MPTTADASLPCIRCGDCLPACPAGLHPQALWQATQEGDDPRALGLGIADCNGCGACDRACPSRLPLAASLSRRREELLARERLLMQAQASRLRFEARQRRLQADAEARRLRERELLEQAASEDAVEAAIARALSRRGPADPT